MTQSAQRDQQRLLRELHEGMLRELDLKRTDVAGLGDGALRGLVGSLARAQIARRALPPGADAAQLEQLLLDEVLGYGPLEPLLADDSVSEIMVNGPDRVFVERGGCLEPAEVRFSSEALLRRVIERMVGAAGRRVDESSPMVDARLRSGARLNVVLPPLALAGPVVTIRKFSRLRLGLEELVARAALDLRMASLLRAAVRARRNVVVSGGTGSGKTTLLNALAAQVPAHERILTIEDAAELDLHHAHVVSLEARPRNLEGQGEVCIRDLVRNALRMRPDRIIVGECRGGEALDMLQAMNTGHEGSLTTAHANSPRDLLTRLEIMVLMAGVDLPLAAVRGQIASAIDLVVQVMRDADGTRRVSHVVEVTGIDSGVIQTHELCWYEHRHSAARGPAAARAGGFACSGHAPAWLEQADPRSAALLRATPPGGARA
jgi:pilus assembly protein CpaF